VEVLGEPPACRQEGRARHVGGVRSPACLHGYG